MPSFIYLIVFGIIKRLYKLGILKAYKPNTKVISVGNITTGGTGKTPFVIALAEEIKLNGRKPGVLIRGYGGDEASILSGVLPKEVPVLVGKDRIKNIKENKYNVDIFILDDGFQHIKLFRDLDIVLIDSTRPFGNGFVLPAGTLREPLSSLKRADIIILTKTDLGRDNLGRIKEKITRINPSCPIFESVHRPLYFIEADSNKRISLDELKDKNVCLVSGIADNESFYNTVKSLGAIVEKAFFFDDHYQYTSNILEDIRKKCIELSLDTVITTQKDYVRMQKMFSEKIKLLVLHIELEIKDEQRQEFKKRLFSIYTG